jgi:energy-converting hydrogenase Eha subunit E
MNFNIILNKIKAKSPEILLGAGVVGVIVGTVEACKATKKIEPIMEEHNKNVDDIHMAKSVGKNTIDNSGKDYTEKDAAKDLTKTYINTGAKLVKLYLPSGLIIIGSIGCMIGSHVILNRRNVALAAAYSALDTCYNEYREQVINKYGDDVDKELRFGVKANKPKDESEEKTYKATEKTTLTPNGYSRFFDETNPFWKKDPHFNKDFLLSQQRYCNDRLKAKGILSLNEAYELLGFEPTKAGQIIGWIYDKNRECQINFGLFDVNNSSKREFINGLENAILLDFNVDGNILDGINMKV